MTEMSEADRKLAQELLAAWDGSSANRPAIKQAVNSLSEDAVSMAQTARRLVTAELAARALPDEDALVAMIRPMSESRAWDDEGFFDSLGDIIDCSGENKTRTILRFAGRAALDAIRPTIAALQARAEAAEAENARLREALERLIYETTHLSPENNDGSHWCKISKETLERARAALGDKS